MYLMYACRGRRVYGLVFKVWVLSSWIRVEGLGFRVYMYFMPCI